MASSFLLVPQGRFLWKETKKMVVDIHCSFISSPCFFYQTLLLLRPLPVSQGGLSIKAWLIRAFHFLASVFDSAVATWFKPILWESISVFCCWQSEVKEVQFSLWCGSCWWHTACWRAKSIQREKQSKDRETESRQHHLNVQIQLCLKPDYPLNSFDYVDQSLLCFCQLQHEESFLIQD